MSLVVSYESAFHFVRNQVKEWKINGVYLIGHSAGAHLVVEIIGRNFFGREKDNSRLKDSILLSGIYEPEVVLQLVVNEDIRVDRKMAFKCNLINKPPLCESPIMICVGGCLLYTSPSPRDAHESRMPSSA